MTASAATADPGRRISTRLLRKGALINETYALFNDWDETLSIKQNLKYARETNVVGTSNEAWLKEVISTLSSRFKHEQNVLPLIYLARSLSLEDWKPCLLWHVGRTDQIYFRFAIDWLFVQFEEDAYQLRSQDVQPFVEQMINGMLAKGKGVSEYGILRASRDLLKMARDFDLLEGKVVKQFRPYHLSEQVMLYVLHSINEYQSNATKLVADEAWRIYLMSPQDVIRELLRLHQFHKVHFQAAGSLSQLKLPFDSPLEFARSLTND